MISFQDVSACHLLNGYFFFLKTLTSAVSNGLIAAVAQIAQSVEQGIENPRVGGSIPSLGTIC